MKNVSFKQLELFESGEPTVCPKANSCRGDRSEFSEDPERYLLTSQVMASDEHLQHYWNHLAKRCFPTKALELQLYQVRWSRRMQKRTLASCNLVDCRVTVAREMRQEACLPHLEALLYHEMCHAVIGRDVAVRGGRRCWHGEEFRQLEAAHPGIPALNSWITSGGWQRAIRSDRAKRQWQKKKARTHPSKRTHMSAIRRMRNFLADLF